MDKINIAIERLKFAAEMSIRYYNKPLLLTYSGGKDSDVCVELAEISGINYEVVNSHTTADAPETVYHIRDKFKLLENKNIRCDIQYPMYKGKRTSMWDLIAQKMIPPDRMRRYCCDILKETSGKNRAIVTGVRHEESKSRENRGIYEDYNRKKDYKIILNNDNDDKRRLFERCSIQAKTICNPIIDWTIDEVWDFLKFQNVSVNPLYNKGFERVGCIGCVLANKCNREKEFYLYPKYKKMYIKAFDKMLLNRNIHNKPTSWKTGSDVFEWYVGNDWRQCKIDFEEYELTQERDDDNEI